MSKIVLSAASRVGRVRSNNEDMVLAGGKLLRSDAYQTEFVTENTDRFVLAIADGMGGHQGGEVASELTLSNLNFFIRDLPEGLGPGELNEAMVDWLHSVNLIVNSRGHVDNALFNMGTTLVGVLFYAARYYWINCGDSRLYRLRNGVLCQITTDHSLNTMTGQKKHSNVITNCIGAGCKNSYIDMFEFTDDCLMNDTYLLCSDGLNDMVPNPEIESLLCQGANANELCEAAIAAGGYDNVSTCVFTVS